MQTIVIGGVMIAATWLGNYLFSAPAQSATAISAVQTTLAVHTTQIDALMKSVDATTAQLKNQNDLLILIGSKIGIKR